jgi:hypothetical protein
MKSGSAITSRDSHDVRHIAAERHARSGRPRWKNEAKRPSDASTNAPAAAATKNSRVAGARSTSAANAAAKSPWPAPISVVRKTTDQAGRTAR